MALFSGHTENAGHFLQPTAMAMGQTTMACPRWRYPAAYANVTSRRLWRSTSSGRSRFCGPMPCEHARDDRISLDLLQQRMKRRPRLRQVLARSRPLRHDGGEDIESAESFAGQKRRRRKRVRKPVPQLVQSFAGTGANPFLQRFVRIGAKPLGKIDDADGCVAIRSDVDESTDDLSALVGRRRQQT